MKFRITLFLLLVSVLSWGQITFTSGSGMTQTQNFNGLPTDVTNNNINVARIGQNWYRHDGTNQTQALTANVVSGQNTSNLSHGVYNCATSVSSTDRALGLVASGSGTHRIGVQLVNSTGVSLSGFDISGFVEKYRNGGSAAVTERIVFEYSLNATNLNNGSWTAISALDLVEPSNATTTTNIGIDGNLAENRSSFNGSITGLTLANNLGIWIRWRDTDDTGNDALLALDDFSVTAIPTSLSPTLVVSTTPATSPVSVSGLNYIFGNGPSTPVRTFTVTGENLAPLHNGNRYVYIEPVNSYFEFSLDNLNFYEAGEIIPFTGNGFSAQTIYTRLKAGLSVGNYSDDVSVSYYNAPTPDLVKTISLSGEVTAPPSPTINLGAFTTTAMTYPLGDGPSASKNATISASNLTHDVTVTTNNIPNWEVSKDNVNFSNSVTYAKNASNNIGAGERIYVRLKSGLAVNTYSGILSASSTGATSQTYNLSGEVFQPVITLTNSGFSQFVYAEGQGPSSHQTFNVSGTNLATDITITVPNTRWDISTNETFSTSLSTITLSRNASNNVINTPIYIRLKAGLLQGDYDNLAGLQVTSLNATTRTADLDGLVTAPIPYINVKALGGSNPSISGNGDATNTPFGPQNTLFAQQTIGDYQTKEFIIENLGGSTLTITSIIVESGTGINDFRIDNDNDDLNGIVTFPIIITPGNSATFPITFAPLNIGVRDAIIRINNDSNNIPAYRYNVRGTGNNAEINITGNGIDIPSGSTAISTTNHTFIGIANANNTTISKEFVVQNLGNIPLETAFSITGADSNQFEITTAPSGVTNGASSNFTITFKPTSYGIKNATISIANNDVTGDEDPYTFAIQGNAQDYVPCAPGEPIVIKQQDFEGANPLTNNAKWKGTINPTGSGATGKVYVGKIDNVYGDELEASANSAIGTASFIITNRSENNSYLLLDAINLSSYTNSSFSFKLASFGASAGNGNDGGDWITVETRENGTESWVEKIKITGADGNTSQTKWSYTSGLATAENSYNNSSVTFTPAQGGYVTTDGYSTVILKDLPSITNLQIRVRGSNGNNEIWAVDNIKLYVEAGEAEKTWSGTAWSGDGLPPTSSQKAIFEGNYNTATHGSLNVCECEVKTGATVTIENTPSEQRNIIVQSDLTIESGANLVVKDRANFIQINDFAVNLGEVMVERITNPMNKYGYTYWGSPVNTTYGAIDWYSESVLNSGNFDVNEDSDVTNVYAWNPTGNPQIGWVYTGATQGIQAGDGFIAKAPNDFHATNKQKIKAIFKGVPNNGSEIKRTIVASPTPNLSVTSKLSFISNPYPSAINIDKFLFDYGQGLTGVTTPYVIPTIYLWTHASEPSFEQNGSYSYSNSDFAAYTILGGTVTSPNIDVDSPTAQVPNGLVGSGQGFFIIGTETGGEVGFRNLYRYNGTAAVATSYNNGHFFRLNTNDVPSNLSDKHRIWLDMSNQNGVKFKQILLGYSDLASDDLDGLDGAYMNGGNSINLYSLLDSKIYTIQAFSMPFEDTDVIPLGYKSNSQDTYTISLSKFDGLFENQDVYIRDKNLGIEQNIKENPYEFSTQAGTFENRFEIIFRTESMNIDDVSKDNSWMVYSKNDKLNIESKGFEIKDVYIYDMLGREIYSKQNISSNSHVINKTATNQVLIVKIISTDNKSSFKKIQN